MRIFGLDLHRTFAEVAVLEEGRVRSAGRVELTGPALGAFARQLQPGDDVVLEATGNTHAVVRALQPHVRRVVVANPLRTRAIADAKIKTDKIDAAVLAQLHASGFLPEVWIPDERTEPVRRQVARRAQIVRHRTRLKNQVHAILHRNLLPRCPAADLFGVKGRGWLATQPLPSDEQATVRSIGALRSRFRSLWTQQRCSLRPHQADERRGRSIRPARWRRDSLELCCLRCPQALGGREAACRGCPGVKIRS
jgi:transposase